MASSDANVTKDAVTCSSGADVVLGTSSDVSVGLRAYCNCSRSMALSARSSANSSASGVGQSAVLLVVKGREYRLLAIMQCDYIPTHKDEQNTEHHSGNSPNVNKNDHHNGQIGHSSIHIQSPCPAISAHTYSTHTRYIIKLTAIVVSGNSTIIRRPPQRYQSTHQ